MSVTILLKDDIDVSRGDMVVQDNALPLMGQDAKATICWFNERPLQLNSAYALKQSTKWTRCMVKSVSHIVDMQTCTSQEPSRVVAMNDIAQIEFKTMQPLVFDPYKNNRETGNFILVDEATNETVAAGMLEA
jgi:sulfate adenylyltransferase subunit 1 (EFTu-like GTPase family)